GGELRVREREADPLVTWLLAQGAGEEGRGALEVALLERREGARQVGHDGRRGPPRRLAGGRLVAGFACEAVELERRRSCTFGQVATRGRAFGRRRGAARGGCG